MMNSDQTIVESLKATRKPLKVAEASEIIGIHPVTAYKWAKDGKMPSLRLGGAVRIDPQALARWVEERSL
jgi:excisionase family DNA binding protein